MFPTAMNKFFFSRLFIAPVMLVGTLAFAVAADPRPQLQASIDACEQKIETIDAQLSQNREDLEDAQSKAVKYKDIADKNARDIQELEQIASKANADTKLAPSERSRIVGKTRSKIGKLQLDDAATQSASRAAEASRLQKQATELETQKEQLNRQIASIQDKINRVRWICKHAAEPHQGPTECAHPEKGGTWTSE
jgi:chromosome segregation ATPase